jgi:hypothetical protein
MHESILGATGSSLPVRVGNRRSSSVIVQETFALADKTASGTLCLSDFVIRVSLDIRHSPGPG